MARPHHGKICCNFDIQNNALIPLLQLQYCFELFSKVLSSFIFVTQMNMIYNFQDICLSFV